jgi:hypothetical protein
MSNQYNPPSAPSWLMDDADTDTDIGSSKHPLRDESEKSSSTSNVQLSAKTRAVLSYKTYILLGLRICTLGLSTLMLCTSIYGISTLHGMGDVGKIFVGVYMFCFSIMLMTFEIIQLRPCEALDHMYRRNFGFLFGIKGKGFFIIFIAFLSFGLGDSTLCIMTGIALMCLGASMVGLFLKYPDLFDV